MRIRMMSTGAEFTVVETGYLTPTSLRPAKEVYAGQVGYIAASIKTVQDTAVGDTVTDAGQPCPRRPCRVTAMSTPWCFPASTRWMAPNTP